MLPGLTSLDHGHESLLYPESWLGKFYHQPQGGACTYFLLQTEHHNIADLLKDIVSRLPSDSPDAGLNT